MVYVGLGCCDVLVLWWFYVYVLMGVYLVYWVVFFGVYFSLCCVSVY